LHPVRDALGDLLVVALVLARTTSGITQASTTLSPSRPWTLQYRSTTAIESEAGRDEGLDQCGRQLPRGLELVGERPDHRYEGGGRGDQCGRRSNVAGGHRGTSVAGCSSVQGLERGWWLPVPTLAVRHKASLNYLPVRNRVLPAKRLMQLLVSS